MMKKIPKAEISLLKEGLNVLKVFPGHLAGKPWSRPVSVNLLVTSRCNSKCATCDSWKLEDHDRELKIEDYRRLAGEIEDLRATIVTIGGGEPLLRPDLWDIVSALKERGRIVQLTTNGLALREAAREKLLDSRLDRVTFSIDSHLPEIYESIRGVAALPSVLENLRDLLSARRELLEIDTNTVLCRENAETFLETLDFLVALGVPKVNFSAVTAAHENYLLTESKATLLEIPQRTMERTVAGLLERRKETKTLSASTDFIRGLLHYNKHPRKVVYPCFAGHLTLDIWQDGSVHGCGNLPPFGNVRDASLKEIWASAAAQANRSLMARGKCPNCYLSCKIELALAAHPLRMWRFAFDRARQFL